MIHAFPGMAADRRMYPTAWASLPEFHAHDWMSHAGERSISEVACSMCEVGGIRDGDILIGTSLGGMVACEITKLRRISALFLVGSAVRKEEVNHLLSLLHPFARVAPLGWLQFSASKLPNELAQMFSGIEASFVRAMCEAVFDWEGLGPSAVPVFRLHGSHDRVIPPPAKVDLLLDGGHLISMTHAEQCVEFIRANQALPRAAHQLCG